MTPELIAAAAIERGIREAGTTPLSAAGQIARAAVEYISAAELVIVPAERMARLIEIERAARALAHGECSIHRGCVRGTDFPTITVQFAEGDYEARDRFGEALREVVT